MSVSANCRGNICSHSACAYAEQGFPVSEIVAELWAGARTPTAFFVDGKPPKQGEVFRNPPLARAYQIVAEQGPRVFYEGEMAAAILRTQAALGGTMSAEDLASFTSEWVEPISIDYRGWRVFELPPNGQGMAALEMLNIMEAVPPRVNELHKRIEAMKLAYADVYRYNGDPRHAAIPVDELLSKDHARKRAALIDPHRANGSFEAAQIPGSDTVYLTLSIARATSPVGFKASMRDSAPALLWMEWVLFCRIAGRAFRSIPATRTCLLEASARFIPSFPVLWKRAIFTWVSALWAAPISRSRTHSLFRTLSIMK